MTRFLPRVTERVPLLIVELPTLPGHLTDCSPVFSKVYAAQSLVSFQQYLLDDEDDDDDDEDDDEKDDYDDDDDDDDDDD
jgi:hypothetical protein